MGFWPHDYDGAWTLDGPARRSGIGLHSGDQVSVTLQPSSQPGVWVSWPANGGEPLPEYRKAQIAASIKRLSPEVRMKRCTNRDLGHLLPALRAAWRITHCVSCSP